MEDALNSLEDVTCNKVEGAMYLFLQVKLLNKTIKEEKQAKNVSDAYYAICLLNATDIVVVIGSGFGKVRFNFKHSIHSIQATH